MLTTRRLITIKLSGIDVAGRQHTSSAALITLVNRPQAAGNYFEGTVVVAYDREKCLRTFFLLASAVSNTPS